MTTNSEALDNSASLPPTMPPLPISSRIPSSSQSMQNHEMPSRAQHLSGTVEPYCSLNSQSSAAHGITKLFRDEYRYQYPDMRMLDADQFATHARNGAFESFIVKSSVAAGEVAAHAAIIPLGNNCLEIGKIIVSKTERHHGLGSTVTAAAIEAARKKNPDLVTAWTFTAHTNSQKIFDRFGFKPIGISIADWPDIFGIGSRESAVIVADLMTVRFRGRRKVYAPAFLQPVLNKVYHSLQCEREFEKAAPVPQSPRFAYPIIENSALSTLGNISVVLPDGTSAGIAARAIESLKGYDAKHISVSVNLTSSDARQTLEALHARGFFFSALHPTAEGDILTLQRPQGGLALARSHLRFHSAEAVELFSLIERHAH